MVTITFKLTEVGTVELDLPTPLSLTEVISLCAAKTGYNPGGYIAVRCRTVVRPGDLIKDGDHLDILPALSGG